MMKGEHVPMATSSDPTWLHLMNHTKLEMTSKPSSMEEPFLNLNSYANFTTGEEHENDRDCALFLNPDNVVSDPPRSFIDAWSSQTQESNHEVKKLSPSSSSSLSLSMGNNNNDKSPSCSWLSPSLTSSWVGSPLGGPLGEVLRPSTASDPPSPFTGNGESGSPPATVASSPSGVLQKTLNAASLSDSSGCSSSSLALGSSNAKPEISLH